MSHALQPYAQTHRPFLGAAPSPPQIISGHARMRTLGYPPPGLFKLVAFDFLDQTGNIPDIAGCQVFLDRFMVDRKQPDGFIIIQVVVNHTVSAAFALLAGFHTSFVRAASTGYQRVCSCVQGIEKCFQIFAQGRVAFV